MPKRPDLNINLLMYLSDADLILLSQIHPLPVSHFPLAPRGRRKKLPIEKIYCCGCRLPFDYSEPSIEAPGTFYNFQCVECRNRFQRLRVDAHKYVGLPPTELTKHQMSVVLNVRLFKLVQRGIIAKSTAREVIKEFRDNRCLGTLFLAYQYKVTQGGFR